MSKYRSVIENRTYRFGGRSYKAIDLIDNLFLAGVELKDIAKILDVDEQNFIADYKDRLETLEKVHKGLLVKAAFDRALSGDKAAIDTLLHKYGWLDRGSSGNDFFEMLKTALNN